MQGPSILLPIPHHDAVHHPPGPHRPDRQPPRARHHDLRPADRGIRRPPDPRQGRRGRHQLPGHGRRLPAGRRLADDRRHRGNPGPLAADAPGRRAGFVVATKAFGRTGPHPWDQGSSRKHLLAAIDASLARLQTDYVDLYQMHGDDTRTPLDETLEALDTIVRSGRARYVGVSISWRIAWPARWGRPSCTASCAWSRCSRATACCSARSSANCCRWRRKRAWA